MQIKSAVSVTLDPDDIAEAVADYVRKHNAGDGPEIDRGSIRFIISGERHERRASEFTITANGG